MFLKKIALIVTLEFIFLQGDNAVKQLASQQTKASSKLCTIEKEHARWVDQQ